MCVCVCVLVLRYFTADFGTRTYKINAPCDTKMTRSFDFKILTTSKKERDGGGGEGRGGESSGFGRNYVPRVGY